MIFPEEKEWWYEKLREIANADELAIESRHARLQKRILVALQEEGPLVTQQKIKKKTKDWPEQMP